MMIASTLSGDQEWLETMPGNFTERSRFNGVFNVKRHDGTRRYSHVSAVAKYQFLFDLDPPHTGRSSLRVYHNPYATRPLDIDVFQGIPQGIFDFANGELQWDQA